MRSKFCTVVYGGWLLLGLVLGFPVQADPTSLHLERYRGKVVYLDFWASWCSPCRQSFPWMNAMQAKYQDQGLVILAVNVDENTKDAAAFLQAVPANFTIVYDPQGKLAEAYQVPGMPTTVVIDRQGKIKEKRVGFHVVDESHYEDNLANLLSAQHP